MRPFLAAACGLMLACSPPVCEGDADQNGEVNFADITNVLANWNAVRF